MKRNLYIVAYDIADPKRLRKVHQVVKQYATGGQKSAFECFLSNGERVELIKQGCSLIDPKVDRFALIPVNQQGETIVTGIALPAVDPDFYYVG